MSDDVRFEAGATEFKAGEIVWWCSNPACRTILMTMVRGTFSLGACCTLACAECGARAEKKP